MKEFITIGYSYDELNDAAKEKVKLWYLDDPLRNEIFQEDIKNYLKENFPRSSLEVTYSLSYCQGDGLNIYGRLNKNDFLEKWDATEKEKKTMEFYFKASGDEFIFENNHRYSYSCKFIDKKCIEDYITEMCDELKCNGIRRINTDIILKFYNDMLNYFEELDKKFEKDGYKYLYECDDEEVKEHCEINDYYFTENGEFIE